MHAARLASGLAGLAVRTVLVAILAVAAWAASGWLLAHVADRVVRAGLRLDGALPAFDVPAQLDAANAGAALPAIAWMLFAIGVTGVVARRIPRRGVLAAGLIFGVSIATDFLIADAVHRPMWLFPSTLERTVAAGDFDRAEVMLQATAGRASASAIDYVRAQIALHAGDVVALRKLAPPLLRDVDRLVYGIDAALASHRAAVSGRWRSDVVHALDVALHGEPLTAVGIAFAEDAGASGLPSMALAVAGVLLALLGTVCGTLWLTMSRRLRTMHGHLTAR